MKLIKQFENFTISFDAETPSIVCKALGHPKSSHYLQEVFKYVIKISEQLCGGIENLNIILDFQHAAGATSEDTEWVARYVTPRLADAGLKKLAVVNPEEDYAKISIQEFMELPPSGEMQQRLFGDLNSAHKWLSGKRT
jgi:hypothetical protein